MHVTKASYYLMTYLNWKFTYSIMIYFDRNMMEKSIETKVKLLEGHLVEKVKMKPFFLRRIQEL